MKSNWPTMPLGELADFRNGLNYTQDARYGGGLPIVGVRDFQARLVVKFEGLEELDNQLIDPGEALVHLGDILFVRSNGNRELIGRSLLVAEEPLRPTTHSGFTIRLRFHDNRADYRFFAYLLRGPLIRRTLSARGGGTNINNLNQDILASLLVPLPPLSVQRRIASILGAYDDVIEVNRRRIAVLEEMARRLFEEWFVHFRFPGWESRVVQQTPDGPLPKGWRWATLRSLCTSVGYGFTASSRADNVGPKFLRITDIVPSTIDWDAVPHCEIDESLVEKYLLHEGDIVVARTGATVGYAKRLNKRHARAVFASYLVRFRPKSGVSNAMLGVFAQSNEYKAYVKRNAGGAAQPNANAQVLGSAKLAEPPENIQLRFQHTIQPMLDLIELYERQNGKLARSRDLLLPRLISGELSVVAADGELKDAA
jgi:type I restriction enzyme, S subunit